MVEERIAMYDTREGTETLRREKQKKCVHTCSRGVGRGDARKLNSSWTVKVEKKARRHKKGETKKNACRRKTCAVLGTVRGASVHVHVHVGMCAGWGGMVTWTKQCRSGSIKKREMDRDRCIKYKEGERWQLNTACTSSHRAKSKTAQGAVRKSECTGGVGFHEFFNYSLAAPLFLIYFAIYKKWKTMLHTSTLHGLLVQDV